MIRRSLKAKFRILLACATLLPLVCVLQSDAINRKGSFSYSQDQIIDQSVGGVKEGNKDVETRMKERVAWKEKICSLNSTKNFILDQYMELFMMEKKRFLRHRIAKYIESVYSISDFFHIHKKRNFGWCMVLKSASTSTIVALTEALTKAEGTYDVKYKVRKVARDYLISVMPPLIYRKGKIPTNITYFVIVRHPLRRLVADYINKFSSISKLSEEKLNIHRRRYGDRIIKKYRRAEVNSSEYENRPTFGEFAEFLVNKPVHDYDVHWRPVYFYCNLCKIKFDLILHMETLDEDFELLSESIGLNLTYNHLNKHPDPDRLHRKRIRDETQELTEVEKKYFSTISKTTLLKLYDIYWLDFVLFNYTINPFDEYAQPS